MGGDLTPLPSFWAEGRTARGTHRKGLARIRGSSGPLRAGVSAKRGLAPPTPHRAQLGGPGRGRGSVCSRDRPARRLRPQSLSHTHSKDPAPPTLSHRPRPGPCPPSPLVPPQAPPSTRLPRRPGPALPRLAEAPPPAPPAKCRQSPGSPGCRPWGPRRARVWRRVGLEPRRSSRRAASVRGRAGKAPAPPGVWTPRPLPVLGSQVPGGPGGPGVPGSEPLQPGPARPRHSTPQRSARPGLGFSLFSSSFLPKHNGNKRRPPQGRCRVAVPVRAGREELYPLL